MKPLVRRTLLVIPVALVVLLAGLLYALHQPRFVLQQLDRQLAASLGWRLEVEGDFSVAWGRVTVMEAGGLRLSNPHWPEAEGQLLFRAGHLRLELRPLELLHGQLDLRQLSLQDCELQLHRDAQGDSNWSAPGQEESAATEAGTDGSRWNLARLDIDSCAIRSRTDGRESELLIELEQAAMQVDGQELLELSANGAIDQQALAIRGTLQPLPALWRGGTLQHSLDVQAGRNTLHSEGTIDDLYGGDGADLSFRFSGPAFEKITDWLALPRVSQGEFDARVSMRRAASDAIMDIGIDADLGSLEIHGEGQLDRLIAPSRGHLAVRANGPDLQALGQTFGVPGLLPQAYSMDLQALVENGSTRLENLDISTGGGRVHASGRLGPWPGLDDSAIDLELHTADLYAWLQPVAPRSPRFGRLDGQFSLAGDRRSGLEVRGSGQLGLLNHAPDRGFSLQGAVRREAAQLLLEQIRVELGADRLDLTGKLEPARDFTGSEVRLGLSIASLADSQPWLAPAATGWPQRPLQLQAELSRPGRGLEFRLAADQANGQKIHLDGAIPDLDRMLAINARFDIELPSLGLAQWLVPGTPLPDLPFTARGELRSDERNHLTRASQVVLRLQDTTLELDAELFQQPGLEGSSAHWTLHSRDWREVCGDPCATIAEVPGLEEISARGQWRRSSGADHFDEVAIDTGLADIRLAGQVAAPGNASRSLRFTLDIRGEDASRLNAVTGPLFDEGPFEWRSGVRLESGRVVADDLEFRQGKTELAGRIEVELAQRPLISARVTAPVLDLTPWREYMVEKHAEQAAGTDPNDGKQSRRLLFPDQAIPPLGGLPVDLSLNLEVGQLLMGTYRIRQLQVDAGWTPQALDVRDFEFLGDQGGHYAGRLNAQQQAGETGLALFTRADDLKLGLIGKSGQDPATLPPSDILVDLSGKGRTWHELAQSLNGRARWYAGPGRVSDTGLDFLFGDLLTQVLTTLNPLAQSAEYTELNCGIYAADFSNGMVTMAPIVIQTDKITAFSHGQVNLADESIDLKFNTVPRKGLGISAGAVVNPFFRIGGTLMKPAVQLDVTKGAISGGVMVATAGLSVLFKSLSDRLLASKDPCGDARSEIEQADLARPGQ